MMRVNLLITKPADIPMYVELEPAEVPVTGDYFSWLTHHFIVTKRKVCIGGHFHYIDLHLEECFG